MAVGFEKAQHLVDGELLGHLDGGAQGHLNFQPLAQTNYWCRQVQRPLFQLRWVPISTSKSVRTPKSTPKSRSPQADLLTYLTKVSVGASSAISQMFFNTDAYFRFIDEARTVGADNCGIEIPRWMRLRQQAGPAVTSVLLGCQAFWPTTTPTGPIPL